MKMPHSPTQTWLAALLLILTLAAPTCAATSRYINNIVDDGDASAHNREISWTPSLAQDAPNYSDSERETLLQKQQLLDEVNPLKHRGLHDGEYEHEYGYDDDNRFDANSANCNSGKGGGKGKGRAKRTLPHRDVRTRHKYYSRQSGPRRLGGYDQGYGHAYGHYDEVAGNIFCRGNGQNENGNIWCESSTPPERGERGSRGSKGSKGRGSNGGKHTSRQSSLSDTLGSIFCGDDTLSSTAALRPAAPTTSPQINPTQSPTSDPVKPTSSSPTSLPTKKLRDSEVSHHVDIVITCNTERGLDCQGIAPPDITTCYTGASMDSVKFSFQPVDCGRSQNSQMGSPETGCEDYEAISSQDKVRVICVYGGMTDLLFMTVEPNIVAPGEAFTVSSPNGRPYPTMLGCTLYKESDSSMLQTNIIDTSGGLPLQPGDTFGALQLASCHDLSCTETLYYGISLFNMAEQNIDIVLVTVSHDGNQDQDLTHDFVRSNPLFPGEAAFTETKRDINVCVAGTYTTSVVADTSRGQQALLAVDAELYEVTVFLGA